MNMETSITKFINNFLKDKLIGQKFEIYKYWNNVSFNENGPYMIQSVDEFSFNDVRDNINSNSRYDSTIPSYNLNVSVININNKESFNMCISIKDLP